MKFSVALIAAVAAAAGVEASVSNAVRRDDGVLAARHARLGRRSEFPRANTVKKRCKVRPDPNANANNNTGGNNNQGNQASVVPQNNNNGGSGGAPPPPPPPPPPAPAPQTKANGLLQVVSSCGAIGATPNITPTAGPNGDIDWLNCGLNNGGWSPPFVQVSDIITVGLRDAIQDPNSPFKACSDFVGLFETYANQHGYPAIILASFAMQESSCNPNTVGGGGEQGLMQLTVEKCGNAPGGNCRDPDFNIRTGAQFFADTLNNNGGDLLRSLGQYNGWVTGLTIGSATAAATSGCCRCQNNLDYLHQFLNGWCQNKNAYDQSNRLGKYFNLDVCN